MVNFFRVVRERPEELERAIALTPYSREEYEVAHGEPADDDLERARRFFCRCWMSYGGKLGSTSGWRSVWNGGSGNRRTGKKSAVGVWQTLPDRIRPAAERLAEAVIECRPALDVIGLYRDRATAVFCDPPYLPETLVSGSTRRDGTMLTNDRKWARYYEHSMATEDHAALLDALDAHPGPVLLSGYRSELYDERLSHWTRVDRKEITMLSKSRLESLWINPNAADVVGRQPLLPEVES